MKIDPYNHKENFLKWKETVKNGIPKISKQNSDTILRYISDMENGLNVSSKSIKGPRSYIRLNNLKQRLIFLAKQFNEFCGADLVDLNEEQTIMFFNSIRNGTIKRKDGKCYTSVVDFVKPFKAFWHWHMKVSKKKDIKIADITEDLDVSNSKPRWVYLTQEQVKKLCDSAKPEYKALIMFMYDTGIRSPSELINIKVSDLHNDFKELNIREDTVKKGSFGRKIKLMLCSDMLKEYVSQNKLNANDILFDISHRTVNQYLKRLSKRVLGDGVSLAGDKYANLTMYDFRHCSCCYWLPRYKSESALKYRFGWRKSDKIHYYSELLGMKDTISEEDVLIDLTKTEIEKRLLKTEKENEILNDKLESYDNEITKIKTMLQIYVSKLKQLDKLSQMNKTACFSFVDDEPGKCNDHII